jgi:hypothetical protein
MMALAENLGSVPSYTRRVRVTRLGSRARPPDAWHVDCCEGTRRRIAATSLAALLSIAVAASGAPAEPARAGGGPEAAASAKKKKKKKCKTRKAKGKKAKKCKQKSGGGLPGFSPAQPPGSPVVAPPETPAGPVRTLSVSRGGPGSGSVLSTPTGIACGDQCAEEFSLGAQVSLHAVPSASSEFAGWTGACTGTAACVVTLDDAKAVGATFVVKTLDLDVSVIGAGGAVASAPGGISCGVDCDEVYDYAQSVSLVPVPAAGWQFHGWTGACSGSGACVVSMTADRSVRAIFTQGGVDHCQMVDPASMTSPSSVPTILPVVAQVTEANATDLDPSGNDTPPLTAQVGIGPASTDPATSPGWAFVPAQQDPGWLPGAGPEAAADQYAGRPVPPAVTNPTLYSYAFRFSLDQGQTWTYCDLDGSQNGLQPGQLGAITVTPFVIPT